MMSNQPNHPEDPTLPDRLLHDLHSLYARPLPVPEHVNRAILSTALAQSARRNRTRLLLRWSTSIAAAAALVLIVLQLTILRPHHSTQSSTPIATTTNPEDIDQNGQINILDAYLLARRIELTEQLKKEWDFNHDGTIDRQDANTIAQNAVTLEGAPLR